MISKLKKYLSYLVRFIKSPGKKVIINELSSEVKEKGLLDGTRSFLHKKMDAKGNYYTQLQGEPYSIEDFDIKTKITLPYSDTPKVSIVIPMYNQLDYTMNCIYSIYRNNAFEDYEIIIADDNSTENSELLKMHFENVIIVKNATNLGFLKNCNNAALGARGEYIVLLNNDTQVQKNWLIELLSVFENNKDAGLVVSKLVYPNGRLQEAGGIIWQDGSGWNYGNQDDPSKPEYNYVKEADYISGASIMISTKLWKELGGFDEVFTPAYYEDTDLCFRVRDKGLKVMYQPFSVVVHFEGVSHGKDLNKGIKQYQVVNEKKFLERWKNELKKKSKNAENVFFERDRTNQRKHVLVVDHYLPQIDKDAGSRCISNFIDSLLALGCSVKFLGENQNFSIQYQKHFQEKGVEVLYGTDFNFYDQSWRKYLKENLGNFDAILLSRSSVCIPVMTFLRNSSYKGNVLYFGHDLGYLRVEKEAAAKNDEDMSKLAKRLKAEEDFMYQNADNSLVLSQDELNFLKKYITSNLHYVPAFFFDVVNDAPAFEEREGLLFVGGFNHPPNRDAMLWFLSEVYEPLYKKGIKLTIVGSLMPDFIFKYKEQYSSLTILSDISIEELDSLYSKTRIAIVPLKFGAGVKGKVIEAMSKGVPIVGTDIAFEGMPKDERFIYKGVNTSAEMADRILEVHSDKRLWQEFSDFGMKYVAENFNRESMKAVFGSIIK